MPINFEESVALTCSTMIKMVGVPTVNVILQKAVWDTGKQIPEASFLEINNGIIDTKNLKKANNVEKEAEIINLLFINIINILTKLLGQDLADKIANELSEVK